MQFIQLSACKIAYYVLGLIDATYKIYRHSYTPKFVAAVAAAVRVAAGAEAGLHAEDNEDADFEA
jgi:hypothetical protein